ncbi:MAG: hypothetical protein ACTSSJ_00890 [Candidatus Odinarchaeia archaeon]
MVRSEVISIVAGVFLGVGQPLMKYGMVLAGVNTITVDLNSVIGLLLNFYFLFGGIISILGIITLIIALTRGKASVLKALSGGSTYICILLLSYFLLFEEITFLKISGISLLILGIYLLGMVGSKTDNNKLGEVH